MAMKLTKRVIDALDTDPDRDVFVWCAELRGFGLRIKPSGTRTFIVQYRTPRGQTRRLALGNYGVLTVDQARTLGRTRLAEVDFGKDPSRERKEARKMTTIAEVCDQYLVDAEAQRVLWRGRAKKASTLLVEASRIRRHIKPLIGKRPVDELTRKDVEAMMRDITAGKTRMNAKSGKPRGRSNVRGGAGTAAKAVKLLSAIYRYAIRKGHAAANPCAGVEKPADNRRERFLSADEYRQKKEEYRQIFKR